MHNDIFSKFFMCVKFYQVQRKDKNILIFFKQWIKRAGNCCKSKIHSIEFWDLDIIDLTDRDKKLSEHKSSSRKITSTLASPKDTVLSNCLSYRHTFPWLFPILLSALLKAPICSHISTVHRLNILLFRLRHQLSKILCPSMQLLDFYQNTRKSLVPCQHPDTLRVRNTRELRELQQSIAFYSFWFVPGMLNDYRDHYFQRTKRPIEWKMLQRIWPLSLNK